jgi:ribosome-binding protein aMBF1 (putative translation factor)
LHRIEKQIHAFLADERARGEWFDIPMDTERLAALVTRAIHWLEEQSRRRIPAPGGSISMALGDRIKQLREARDMSQRQLAIATKLPQSLISQIETGVRPGSGMRVDAARRIAFALGVSLDALVGTPVDAPESELLPALAS